MPPPEHQRNGRWRGAGPAVALGTNIAVGMVLFSSLGWYVDTNVVGSGDIFTLGGMFLGLFYAAYEVWKVVRLGDGSDRPSGNDDEA